MARTPRKNRIPINLVHAANHRFYAATHDEDYDGGMKGICTLDQNTPVWSYVMQDLRDQSAFLQTLGATHIVEVRALSAFDADEYERLWTVYGLVSSDMAAYPDAGSW